MTTEIPPSVLACWGSRGGIDTGTGYRVAMCQPSPVDGSAPLFFDFIPIQL